MLYKSANSVSSILERKKVLPSPIGGATKLEKNPRGEEEFFGKFPSLTSLKNNVCRANPNQV